MFEVMEYAMMIAGNAVVGNYFAYTSQSDMKIAGIQLSVQGTLPTGGNHLRFHLMINAVDYPAYDISMDANGVDNYANESFVAPLEIDEGDEIYIVCDEIGAGNPGSWIEVRFVAQRN